MAILKSDDAYPSIVIHCQYVYGIGHYVRAIELARGLSSRFKVYFLNGGEVVPNFELPATVNVIQLPAIYKNETENHLTPVDPSQSLAQCFELRSNIIKQTLEVTKPAIVITEHFPFGLLFEKEVMELIHQAKRWNPTAKIVCSVRDIIESSEGNKNDSYTCNLINKWYDMVLVHGDEKFAALSTSFPKIHEIKVPVVQTGYIARPIPTGKPNKKLPIVLASIAGGRLGNELLDAMIDSHKIINERIKYRLVLFSGAFQADVKKQRSKTSALGSDDIQFKIFDSQEYLKCLSKASLVVSLGGYNSIIESVSVNKPLLVYNRDFAGNNKEQHLRIKLFEKTGHLDVITPEDLIKERLSNIIIKKITNLEVPRCELNMGGVETSRQSLTDLISF